MRSNTIAALTSFAGILIALTHINAYADSRSSPGELNTPASTTALTSPNTHTTPLRTYQTALNYLLGRNGAEKSAEKAASLFKTLAEQNWSSAQHMLGNMYLRGKGVEKNDLLAYKWLSLASKNNMQLAKAIHNKRQQLYINLQNNLSLQSLHKVESWIAEWKPSISHSRLN